MAQLAIDSSTPIASLSILSDHGEVFTIEAKDPNSHIETLSMLLDNLLQANNIPISNLKSIILGAGPGSFTGLRIGYSFVAGLAMALRIPVTEVSSLQAMANLNADSNLQVVLTDARRNEFFTGIYQVKQGKLSSVNKEEIMTLDYLERFLTQKHQELNLNLADLKVYCDLDLKLFDKFIPQKNNCLSANLLKLVTINQIKIPDFSLDLIANLKPNYLRSVAAVKLNEPRGA